MNCSLCGKDKKEEQILFKKGNLIHSEKVFWTIIPFAFLALGLIFLRITAPRFLPVVFYFAGYTTAGIGTFRKFLKHLRRGRLFDENFLVILATTGALALQEFAEATTVMALYALGEFLEKSALERSSRSIQHLLAGKPEFVHVQKDNRWMDIPPQEVEEGAIIRIDPGEKILLDGIILEGTSHLDTSSLTGEPLPLFRKKGDEVLSGSINREGSLIIKATKNYANSTINTVTELLGKALQRKASTERLITRFARFYTPSIISFALLLLILPLIRGIFTSSHLYQALTLLMISCPCALVISIPLGFLAGIGKSAREGILIKGSSCSESLAFLSKCFAGKTGTLTDQQVEGRSLPPSHGHPPR
ncbi:MAG: HAD-IC family P-type ATPase, partial [Atribacterota bacterium]